MEVKVTKSLLMTALITGSVMLGSGAAFAAESVGEFDLEYKLTRSGEISLKAYNHSNDNNLYQYMKQSMTTQGVGIKFQKEFNHLSELFRRRRLLLPTVRGDSIPASQPE